MAQRNKQHIDIEKYNPEFQAVKEKVHNSINEFKLKQAVYKQKQELEKPKTDAEIISEYESIPKYNILQRGGYVSTPGLGRPKSVERSAYEKKQSLHSAYRQAKDRQISSFISDNKISDSALELAKQYNREKQEINLFGKKWTIGHPYGGDEYKNIKTLADNAGINIDDIFAYDKAVTAREAKDRNVKYAEEHPVIGTLATFPVNLSGNMISAAEEVGNYITGDTIGSNAAVNALSETSGSMRKAVSDKIANPVGKFVYDVGTSIGDMGTSMLAGGKPASLALMSIGAGANTLNDVKYRDITPDQMMGTAIASGIIEAATEKTPLDKLFKMTESPVKLTAKQILKNVKNQAISESIEEGISEVANSFADYAINGKESDWSQSIKNYMNQGMTREQAERKTAGDLTLRTLQASAAGAVSGGIMAGGASVYSNTKLPAITKEQFQANNDFIGKLENVNNGQNYLESYNQRAQSAQNPAEVSKVHEDIAKAQNAGSDIQNAEGVGNFTNDIHAGKATIIRSEYMGEKPIQKILNKNRVTISDESYNNAVQNINTAQIDNKMTGVGIKNILTKVYENVFESGSTSKDVAVNGTSFGDRNYLVTINKSAIGKIMSDPNFTAEKIAVIDNIEDVVGNANYVGSGNFQNHGTKQKRATRYDYFETEAYINGENYVVTFDVEVTPGQNNYRTHKVINEMSLTPTPVTGPVPAAKGANGSALEAAANAASNSSIYNIPKAEENVNRSTGNAQENSGNMSSVSSGKYTSQTVLNSIMNSEMVKRAQKNMDFLQNEIDNESFKVDKVSEELSIKRAAENLSANYEGEVDRLKNSSTLFSGVETDESMMILDNLLADSERTGDYSQSLSWIKSMAGKAHNVGQALQALAKYTRTPEGTLIKSQQIINKNAESFYKDNPNARIDVENTVNQLWNELEQAGREARMLTLNPDAQPLDTRVKDIVRSVMQQNRTLRTMDNNSLNNAADYIAKQIQKGVDHNQISEDIQNYAATGLFGLEDTDVQTVMDMLGEAETMPDSEARYELEQKAINIIANKVAKADFMDKWNSWRYLSMLGNTKTHLRNTLGNHVNGFVKGVENNVAAVLEEICQKSGMEIDRTKAILNPVSDKALIDAGKTDATSNVYSLLKDGGSNYNNMMNRIESSKRIFNNNLLEKVRKFNNEMLEREDFSAMKKKYATSLAGYLKANGYDVSIFNSKSQSDIDFLNKARTYAIEQAKEATFHEYNSFASALNRASLWMKNQHNGWKVGNVIVEGLMPFKKTPANILKQGAQYALGPIEVAKGVGQLVNSVKKGKYTATQAIDTMSKGLTGTGIMALGYFLSGCGFLSGGESDDEKDNSFDKLTGGQNYALKIGDKSYTIDWLAPFSLPLFVGVSLRESHEKVGGLSLTDILASSGDALAGAAAPMIEMSMLDGLSSALEDMQYEKKPYDAAFTLLTSSAANYASQGIPTALGQIARTVDPIRRTSTPQNTGILGTLEYAGRKAMNKIPGLSMLNEPYVDGLGNTQENTGGNLAGRLLYNMLSPGYYSEQSYDSVEKSLMALRNSSDDSGVYNLKAGRSVYTEEGKVRLSNSEYTKYAQEKGKVQHELLENLFASADYKGLSDDQKVSMVSKIYKSAGEIAQSTIPGKEPKDKKISSLYKEIGEKGLCQYLTIQEKNKVDGVSTFDAIDASDLSEEEKGYFINLMMPESIKRKAIHRAYGDEGLYKWQSMWNKADSDGNGSVSNSDMLNQIIQSGMPYADMLNYATVLYNDTKTKTARQKAEEGLKEALSNIEYNNLLSNIRKVLGKKSDEEIAKEREQKIQGKVDNISGGTEYEEMLRNVRKVIHGEGNEKSAVTAQNQSYDEAYAEMLQNVREAIRRSQQQDSEYQKMLANVRAVIASMGK